jgi:phenylacetic acid degradation operon negative regulatory protein
MTAASPLLSPLIDDLHANGRLRVWSLIVTILGDVAIPRGGVFSVADLITICEHLRIDSGAVRTALSRLRKDDWVVNTRDGRASFYQFSAAGNKAARVVVPRVYAPVGPVPNSPWHIAVFPVARAEERARLGAALVEMGAIVPASAGFALWVGAAPTMAVRTEAADCLLLSGDALNVPAWLIDALCPETARQAFVAYCRRYWLLRDVTSLSPLDALCARVLLIHDWRRLMLRHPRLPDALQPSDWPRNRAHEVTAAIYGGLLQHSDAFWPDALPNEGAAILAARF